MPTLKYRQSLVVYLDILGFRQMVKASEEDASRVKRIQDVLKRLSKRVNDSYFGIQKSWELYYLRSRFRSVVFSDLAIRATDIEDYAPSRTALSVSTELRSIIAMQLDLACPRSTVNQILLRGAITIGAIQASTKNDRWTNEPIFGPALVRAYELENRQAIYPRIVVDPRIEDFLAEIGCAKYLRRSDDGVLFLDYLLVRDHYNPTDVFNDHKLMIEKKVRELRRAKASEEVVRKFQWLALYHNCVVKEYAADDGHQYIADEQYGYLIPEKLFNPFK